MIKVERSEICKLGAYLKLFWPGLNMLVPYRNDGSYLALLLPRMLFNNQETLTQK
jgi:hypothetical protein